MNITIMLDQSRISKADRRFIYFTKENKTTNVMTVAQGKTIFNAFVNLGINVDNQTGLNLC